MPSDDKRDADPVEFGYFIMDLGDHAEWAIRDGDHLKAAHLYGALARAVPDTAVGFVKACAEYEAAKALDSAILYCAASLTTKGITLADYSHYARLLLQKKSLTAADIANLDAVVKHLAAQPGASAVALDIQCTLGAHESDRARLEDCVPKLSAIAPDSPKALFYQWALAMKNKDFASAERILAKARTEPGAKEQVAQMEHATTAALPPWRRGLLAFRDWRVGATFTMALVAALSALLLRRRPAPSRSERLSRAPETRAHLASSTRRNGDVGDDAFTSFTCKRAVAIDRIPDASSDTWKTRRDRSCSRARHRRISHRFIPAAS